MKPDEETCQNPAVFRYTWPGRDESCICLIHAIQLQNVAMAMGLHIQLIKLSIAEMMEAHCSQIIKKEKAA
jgi:hypothetical protein